MDRSELIMNKIKFVSQNKFIDLLESKDSYQDKINKILKLEEIPSNLKIEFALYCAKDCYKYIDAVKYPDLINKVNECLELVGDYLLGKEVNKDKLNNAAYAANAAANAAYAAAYAANAAANAANAAAYAANAAAYAANAAAYAANAAAYAANAAANAAYAAANAAYAAASERYYNHLLTLVGKYLQFNNKLVGFLYL